jgi:hypothetical protein
VNHTLKDIPVGAQFYVPVDGKITNPYFVWTRTADRILDGVLMANVTLTTPHGLGGRPIESTIDDDEPVVPAATCFDCVHAEKSSGSPGDREIPEEEPSAECPFYDTDTDLSQLLDAYGDCAAGACLKFKPEMVGKCYVCDVAIDSPAHAWRLWISSPYEHLPACSEEHKAKGQIVIDAKVALEMNGF